VTRVRASNPGWQRDLRESSFAGRDPPRRSDELSENRDRVPLLSLFVGSLKSRGEKERVRASSIDRTLARAFRPSLASRRRQKRVAARERERERDRRRLDESLLQRVFSAGLVGSPLSISSPRAPCSSMRCMHVKFVHALCSMSNEQRRLDRGEAAGRRKRAKGEYRSAVSRRRSSFLLFRFERD